jgi:hypothetical protein
VPPIVSAGCTILTYELFAADEGIVISEVFGMWYVNPTSTSTEKAYYFRIRGLNPLCADITTQVMSFDVGCTNTITTWPALVPWPDFVSTKMIFNYEEGFYSFTLPISKLNYCSLTKLEIIDVKYNNVNSPEKIKFDSTCTAGSNCNKISFTTEILGDVYKFKLKASFGQDGAY